MATNATQVIYYLYNFNSYSDRRCIKYNTLNEYLSHTGVSYDTQTTTNFCEGDGVLRGGVTYRKSLTNITIPAKGTPDYALVVNNGNIESRWYVVDSVNKNNATYSLILKRDSVADFYSDIINAPTYIEKATLLPNSPFIFNQEDMSFNQIKQSETLLKDKTGCPWIIGFMAQKQPEGTSEPFTTTVATNMMGQPDVTYSSMANYPYWAYMGSPYHSDTNYYKCVSNSGSAITWLTVYINAYDSTGITGRTSTEGYTYYYTPNSGWSYITGEGQNPSPTQFNTAYRCDYDHYSTIFRKLYRAIAADSTITELARNYASLYYSDIHTTAQGDAFAAEAGKIVKTNNSATQPTTGTTYAAGLYSLSVPYSSTGFVGDMYYYDGTDAMATTLANTSSQLHQAVLNILAANAADWGLEYRGNYSTAAVAQEAKFYLVDATPTSADQITFSFTGNEKGLGDAPYRMFALPYNDNVVKWKFGGSDANVLSSNKNINMSVAQGIAKTFSGTWLYDLQLVPFCPFVKSDRVTVNSNNEVIIDIQNLTYNTDYNTINYNGNHMAYILWCDYSQVDNYQIPFTINAGSTAEEIKVNNQCDMYRLSAPAYNSVFEFSAEMNNGVNGFDVDIAYKPYDSYIHINPNWGGLYGSDFNDARGLVFTGPFSLPQTTSAWMQYKLNNMNYQNSFDRQIENMKTMHKYDMKELGIKGITGIAQGAVTGATTGAMIGGGWGALAGAVVGGAASAVGSAADQQLATKRYNETIDYTNDQFNYNLQNVQAQAQALSKVSSFTPNNKVFPILEYYTCTEPEKEALRNKIKYNGMSVGVIDTINNYLRSEPTYIKGQVIRLTINEENHMVEDIKNEINKGVFI